LSTPSIGPRYGFPRLKIIISRNIYRMGTLIVKLTQILALMLTETGLKHASKLIEKPVGLKQRILDDLESARLSRHPMVCSYPMSRQYRIDRLHTGRLRKRENLLMGEGVGEETNHTTARKPGPL
jgi:hypothetical protein